MKDFLWLATFYTHKNMTKQLINSVNESLIIIIRRNSIYQIFVCPRYCIFAEYTCFFSYTVVHSLYFYHLISMNRQDIWDTSDKWLPQGNQN